MSGRQEFYTDSMRVLTFELLGVGGLKSELHGYLMLA